MGLMVSLLASWYVSWTTWAASVVTCNERVESATPCATRTVANAVGKPNHFSGLVAGAALIVFPKLELGLEDLSMIFQVFLQQLLPGQGLGGSGDGLLTQNSSKRQLSSS
jgi:hypothetical protein